MAFRGRAVTASKPLLAQLITKVAFVAAFKSSRVSIPAKTATAQQIMQTRLQKTQSFTYLCKEIHALRERCGAWMERKNV